MGYAIIYPINNNKRKIMQYFILRKQKLWDKYEYDTEPKAKRGYTDLGDVSKKLVALENLNENDDVKYIIVKDTMTE